MTSMQKLCLVYFVVLMIAASLNYIPGLTNEDGLAFGIFALDIYDDALHVASALWALIAGLLSHRAARTFMILFGIAYLGDGVFGFFTGYGYLDLGIFTNASAGLDFSLGRVLANVPHLALGALAVWAGFTNIGRRV
ncbi:membrane protein [Ruegeria halocynthiae]|uniref:membrane protein n=1 Tax=Ruegeria halocynthiae TaxID=985054 RepID=UPI0005654B4B|nr:membrane protein [Ruegeria halocynthiae]